MLKIRKSITEDIQELKDTLLESFVQASIDDFGNDPSLHLEFGMDPRSTMG